MNSAYFASAQRRLVLLMGVVMTLPAISSGQYELFHWTNFEEGRIPDKAVTIGNNPTSTHEIVNLPAEAISTPGIYDSNSAYELGNYALKIKVRPPQTSVMNGIIVGPPLSRETLGPDGIAILQADVFLPNARELPNVAILAVEPPSDKVLNAGTQPSISTEFYRFGFSSNEVPYFSYSRPEKDRPVLFLQDRDLLPYVPRGGWRRLTFVISADHISGYIDGRGTVFSPHPQRDLSTVMAGVLVAESKLSYDVYVDNISVQIARSGGRLAESPFDTGWTIPAGEAALKGGVPYTGAVRDKRWMNPLTAWQKAQQSGQPLLLFFCSPGTWRSDEVEKLFGKPESSHYLSSYVPARVDVNQVRGGKIAQDYQVYKVPSILVISPDGSKYRRVTPEPSQSLQAIFEALRM